MNYTIEEYELILSGSFDGTLLLLNMKTKKKIIMK